MKTRFFLLLILFVCFLLFQNCSRTLAIPCGLTSLGSYSSVQNIAPSTFKAIVAFEGIDSSLKKFRSELLHLSGDSVEISQPLPKIAINLINGTDSVVVIEFPFYWNRKFISLPVLLHF
jgi:hypothetical protein